MVLRLSSCSQVSDIYCNCCDIYREHLAPFVHACLSPCADIPWLHLATTILFLLPLQNLSRQHGGWLPRAARGLSVAFCITRSKFARFSSPGSLLINFPTVTVGWKYEEAFEQSQKYKEGKAVLEKARMTREEWST